MRLCHLCLGRVSISIGGRDSNTNKKQKRAKGKVRGSNHVGLCFTNYAWQRAGFLMHEANSKRVSLRCIFRQNAKSWCKERGPGTILLRTASKYDEGAD